MKRACSKGCASSCSDGGAKSQPPAASTRQRSLLAQFGAPDVIIADYHLDEGNGVETVRALRENLGRMVPAILATADRSLEVRDEAARAEIVILNKPLKPAPLRAQLTRYSAMREAAE